MAYSKVQPANKNQSIITEADKNIAKAEGEMMMDTIMDPVANTLEVAADSLKIGKSIKTGKEMIADSDFLEKEDDGSFVKEPKTEFGKNIQSRLSDAVGPSTEDQMTTISTEAETKMSDYHMAIKKEITDEITTIGNDERYNPYKSEYFEALNEWIAAEMSSDGRTKIVYDENNQIIGGGEAITGEQFWKWVETQEKYKHLPKNPNLQKPIISSGISMEYRDIQSDHEDFYQHTIGSNVVLAHRHNERMLNNLGINNENVTELSFQNNLNENPLLKQYITDGAIAYYSRISGGKTVSKHTINRLNNGTLLG